MLQTLRNALKVKDIRSRLLYTFIAMIIVRLGCALPVPGVDHNYFQAWMATQSGLGF